MNNKKNLEILKEDIKEVWNQERFGIVRYPHAVGQLKEKEDFLNPIESVLDMPIKLPNSEIRIPSNLATKSILEIVEKCVEFEKTINENWEDYHIYLTVHHSFVEAQNTQRRPGAHIDGMQGERYPNKLPVCHSYLVSNEVPTRFFNHELPTNLCEKTQNWFYEFDKVKKYGKSSLSNPFEITLMTAYSLHESTQAEKDVLRTFVRLEFSLKQFNRIGNSINPMFDLDWVYEEREIPKSIAVLKFN